MSRKKPGSPNRAAEAMASEFEVRAFCKRAGLALRVMNDAQHWVATDNKQLRVEWWPSTAKAVRGTSQDRFHNKVRVATVDQFIELVEQELEAVEIAPRAVRMKPDEKPIYPEQPAPVWPEQPTLTAMPTDWNTCRGVPKPVTVLPEKPTTKQTVTIADWRYAELLAIEKRCGSLEKMFVLFLIGVFVATAFATQSYLAWLRS